MTEWQKFVTNARRHGITDPKLVCIDIQPYGSSQAPERDDILNIGGFSDAVFNIVPSFPSRNLSGRSWRLLRLSRRRFEIDLSLVALSPADRRSSQTNCGDSIRGTQRRP
jgi:hypothetical protein